MAIAFSVPFYRIPCASARLDVQLPAGEYGVDDEALTIPSDIEYGKPIDQVDIGNARANSREVGPVGILRHRIPGQRLYADVFRFALQQIDQAALCAFSVLSMEDQ